MTTYSISLDDVDLALLPMPSHTYNNFLKKENCQFQVMKSAPEPTTQYICHICAIEVPVAFAYEHAASVKHRANVCIASEAAERMRAFISALPPPHVAQPSTRFCENCATEVEEGHEKTKEHHAAALLDSLLWDLMKAYLQDDDGSTHNQHGNNYNGKLNENTKLDFNFNNIDKDNKNNGSKGNIYESTKLIENEAETEEIDEEEMNEDEEIEENCETDTGKHSEDDEANVSSNESENIQSINSDTPSVAEKGIYVNWLEHYDFEHLRRIAKFGSDGQYVREIDELYSHCILCNQKIENVDMETHIQSSSHNLYISCYTNTRQINEAKTKETETETNKENGISPTEKNTVIKTESPLKSVDTIEYPYELTGPSKLRYVLCECQVPSGVCNREQHINGFRHRTAVLNKKHTTEEIEKNTEETLADTSKNTERHERNYGEELRKFVDDEYFFEFREFREKDAESDMFRLQLDDNILETYIIRFHSFYPIGDEKYECQVCNYNFDKEHYEEHTYDLKHLRIVANLENYGHFVRKIDEEYSHCILCNDKMENKDVASHKKSEEHKKEKERTVSAVETDTDNE